MNSTSSNMSNNIWAGAELLDSMLAETGYAIPQSQLPELADRIQYLESLVSGTQIADLVSDSLFTNPSDISTWINSLIKTGSRNSDPVTQPGDLDDHLNHLAEFNTSDDHLELIEDPCSSKSAGNGNSLHSISSTSSNVPVLVHHLVPEDDEAEASGVQLIHLLLACASCIEDPHQLRNAEAILNEIRLLLISMGERSGAMGRVALYFAQGLEQRLLKKMPSSGNSDNNDNDDDMDPSFLEMLHLQFYHTCPYLKFGHFTANQAMLEELEGEKMVHIIDLEPGLGLQWPPLIHMLAIGGTPVIRFTAVSGDPRLGETGMRLAQLAASVNVELRFHRVEGIESVQLHPGETVAVNSMLQLHRLLHDPKLITSVLATIRGFNPRIFTVVEQEADHNSEVFQTRFFDALHHYSSLFDAIDAAGGGASKQNQDDGIVASEAYLGREIRNIVACEGKARVERHERLNGWMNRLLGLGFEPRHLGSNAFNQAATLLTIFPGGGHAIYENSGCLTLGWHTRPLISASAWRCR